MTFLVSDLITSKTCDPALAPAGRVPLEREQPRTAATLAVIAGLMLAVILAYWPSALALHRLWTNAAEETYTHGYLILLLSL